MRVSVGEFFVCLRFGAFRHPVFDLPPCVFVKPLFICGFQAKAALSCSLALSRFLRGNQVGLLQAPLPAAFNVTLAAPDLRRGSAGAPAARGNWAAAQGAPPPHPDAAKVVVTGVVVAPVVAY